MLEVQLTFSLAQAFLRLPSNVLGLIFGDISSVSGDWQPFEEGRAASGNLCGAFSSEMSAPQFYETKHRFEPPETRCLCRGELFL